MADVRHVTVGGPVRGINYTISPANFSLDGSGDKIAFIFQAEEAATITHLGVRLGTKTGNPPTYKISFQGVDASTGTADGTVLGGASPASATFDPTAWTAGTFNWVALANSYAVTRGQNLAIVVEYDTVAGETIDGSNYASFSYRNANINGRGWTYDGATWTGSSTNGPHGYKSSTKAYGWPCQTSDGAVTTFENDRTPDEVGMKITVPAAVCATYKIAGLMVQSRMTTANTSMDIVLYDTDGTTVLQSVTLDSEMTPTNTHYVYFDEATLSTLNAGSAYRLVIKANDAVSSNYYYYMDFPDAISAECADFGGNVVWTERTDAGAWTDTNTRRFGGAAILSDITEPTAGGGGNSVFGSGIVKAMG